MIINLPKDVKYIIDRLIEAGYEAYAVGGCVRDTLLNRTPDDWDITTSAKPLQIKELFRPTIDTGIQHGTVTVLRSGVGYEVTTYRIDGEYEDARHPKEVTFTANLEEDLKRRDFTINAMAYNEKDGLIDCFGGMNDLESEIIRCVGDARERFNEDALRMMRAIRFSAQLGYSIEQKTSDAIKELASNLDKISAERINVELTKLITSGHPEYIVEAYNLGIMDIVMPEFAICMKTSQNNPHHCYTVGEHIVRSMKGIRDDRVLRYTMLFHDITKPQFKTTDSEGIDHFHGHAIGSAQKAHEIMKRLRFDNDALYKIERLVEYHDYRVEPTKKAVRHAINKVGEDLFDMLLEVQKADLSAQSKYEYDEKFNRIEQVQNLYESIIEDGECVSLKTLAVTGSDLIKIGIEPGPGLGEILKQLLSEVLDDPGKNKQDILLEIAKGYLRNGNNE